MKQQRLLGAAAVVEHGAARRPRRVPRGHGVVHWRPGCVSRRPRAETRPMRGQRRVLTVGGSRGARQAVVIIIVLQLRVHSETLRHVQRQVILDRQQQNCQVSFLFFFENLQLNRKKCLQDVQNERIDLPCLWRGRVVCPISELTLGIGTVFAD